MDFCSYLILNVGGLGKEVVYTLLLYHTHNHDVKYMGRWRGRRWHTTLLTVSVSVSVPVLGRQSGSGGRLIRSDRDYSIDRSFLLPVPSHF